MKRAFTLMDGHLVSALVPRNTPEVLFVGDRITFTLALDMHSYAQIEAGETGTIDFIDATTGCAEVAMDLLHRGLHMWHNHLWLEPFETDDILSGVKVTQRAWVLTSRELMGVV